MSVSVLVKELDTLYRIYEPQGKTPEMVAETKGDLVKGDEVVAHDGNGATVKCVVRHRLVAVVPDWETYSKGVGKGQGALL